MKLNASLLLIGTFTIFTAGTAISGLFSNNIYKKEIEEIKEGLRNSIWSGKVDFSNNASKNLQVKFKRTLGTTAGSYYQLNNDKYKLSWDIEENTNGVALVLSFYDSSYHNPIKGNVVLSVTIPFSFDSKFNKYLGGAQFTMFPTTQKMETNSAGVVFKDAKEEFYGATGFSLSLFGIEL